MQDTIAPSSSALTRSVESSQARHAEQHPSRGADGHFLQRPIPALNRLSHTGSGRANSP